MGRMLFGLFLGFSMVFAVAFWVHTCLPDPNDPGIQWLHREDVVVVQEVVSDPSSGGATMGEGLPVFTLYGDGTLITVDNAADKPRSFSKRVVSANAVASLLRYVDDRGFFSIQYEPQQAAEVVASTYIYAATKFTANAVRADGPDIQSVAGRQDLLKDIQEIDRKLHDLVDEPGRADSYTSDNIMLAVQTAPEVGLYAFDWPFPDIDLAAIAADRVGSRRLEGTQAKEVSATVGTGKVFRQGNRPFDVDYRPVLPHEENFPEFEPPAK